MIICALPKCDGTFVTWLSRKLCNVLWLELLWLEMFCHPLLKLAHVKWFGLMVTLEVLEVTMASGSLFWETLWLHSTTSILSISLFSDARVCEPLSSFNPVCVSNCCSRLSIKWGHLLAVVMACSVLFASRCCNAYLIVRFKCSMWRSQGMLLPSLPCTLIHLEYMMKIQVHDRKENHVDACNLFL